MARENDLLIIGAGTLGGRVGALWCASHPGVAVLAETRTPSRHAALGDAGMRVRVRDDGPPPAFPNVLYSLPASQPGYADECARAVKLWNEEGNLVITSSTAVYAESDGNACEETSPLADSERARRLLDTERVVLEAGGVVVRLAGLYDRDRGPHRVYLRTSESPRRPDGLVNLVHYDDAARLCALALEKGEPGRIYMGCDNAPITRAELAAAAAAAEAAHTGDDRVRACSFTAAYGPLGRRCDNSWTRKQLGWTPRFASFVEWSARGGAQ